MDANLSLWPRLLAAAPDDLGAKLRELRANAASLGLKKDGGLSLGPGTRLTQAEYDEIKSTLDPDAMRQALRQARDGEHPWIAALHTAYADLRGRCDQGTDALRRAGEAKDGASAQKYTLVLLKRHMQAVLVLEALHGGGVDQTEAIEAHMREVIEIGAAIEKAGGRAPVTNVSWPVPLPEGGRLWLIDGPDAHCEKWVNGEPRLISSVLAEALKPLSTLQRMVG